jgi:general stress protein 26
MDRARLEAIWSPAAAAWFRDKDDAELRMLALELKDAAIWASTGDTLAYAWETTKATLSKSEPEVGVRNARVFT